MWIWVFEKRYYVIIARCLNFLSSKSLSQLFLHQCQQVTFSCLGGCWMSSVTSVTTLHAHEEIYGYCPLGHTIRFSPAYSPACLWYTVISLDWWFSWPENSLFQWFCILYCILYILYTVLAETLGLTTLYWNNWEACIFKLLYEMKQYWICGSVIVE